MDESRASALGMNTDCGQEVGSILFWCDEMGRFGELSPQHIFTLQVKDIVALGIERGLEQTHQHQHCSNGLQETAQEPPAEPVHKGSLFSCIYSVV